VQEVLGAGRSPAIRYECRGDVEDLGVNGVFIFCGLLPNSNMFKIHVDHDAVDS
jgi:alkyl hydroperoxide reductase subunit AhpF